jgi:hypothetical protein
MEDQTRVPAATALLLSKELTVKLREDKFPRDQLLLYRACLDFIRKHGKAPSNVAELLDQGVSDTLALLGDGGYPEGPVEWLLRMQAYLDRTGCTLVAAMAAVRAFALGDHERITEELVVLAIKELQQRMAEAFRATLRESREAPEARPVIVFAWLERLPASLADRVRTVLAISDKYSIPAGLTFKHLVEVTITAARGIVAGGTEADRASLRSTVVVGSRVRWDDAPRSSLAQGKAQVKGACYNCGHTGLTKAACPKRTGDASTPAPAPPAPAWPARMAASAAGAPAREAAPAAGAPAAGAGTGSRGQAPAASADKGNKTAACYNCGKQGHMAKACPDPCKNGLECRNHAKGTCPVARHIHDDEISAADPS